MIHPVLQTLSLCAKAGRLCSGETASETAIKSGDAFLCIVAEDASAGTIKKFTDSCSFYEVPIELFGTKEDLGRAIGKEYRSSICINDEGFANAILKKLGK